MRATLDILGHHIVFAIDHPGDDDATGGERTAEPLDALVERPDPWAPPLGFGSPRRPGPEPSETPEGD